MRLIDADALLANIKADRYTNAQDAIFFITNSPTVHREGWVSLTDDEIAMIISNQVLSESNPYDYLKFARSVEKMILDKNK